MVSQTERKVVLSMNHNNFDNNSSGQSPFDGYDVYSKQYTPNAEGYTEKKQHRSGAGESSRGRSRRILAAICITVACLLAFSAVGFVSAKMAFSYYENLFEQYREELEEEKEPGVNLPLDPPEEETESGLEKDNFFFTSEEDTEIKLSDTPAIAVDGSIGDPDLTKAEVAALVADSVVEITTSETHWNGLAYQSGAGSGVIVNASGVIITNNHVIEAATNISVRLTNGNVYEARLVATDADTDIAVLKIEPTEALTVAVRGNSDNIVVGEEVLAIGNPLGVLGGTVTNGIVSALGREVTVEGETMTLLQHNAAISPGNSGGALFNMRGELIGIVNAKYSSSGAEGLGFAIPMNTVMEVYEDLCEFGYVKGRADHGLTITTDRYYIFQGYLYIYSSRYTDELQYGDRLLAIGDAYPATVEEAYALLDQYGIGEKVEVTVVRNGKQVKVSLEIREYEPQS